MLSNLPPDWRGEPPEHDRDCATRCDERDNPECIEHGDEHYCNCEELRESRAQALAEGAAEQFPYGDDNYY